MGNVQAGVVDKAAPEEEDKDWLQIHEGALFDESFLNGQSVKLPTSPTSAKKKEDELSDKTVTKPEHILLMEFLGSYSQQAVDVLSDLKKQNIKINEVEDEMSVAALQKRMLQRIHLAIIRSTKDAASKIKKVDFEEHHRNLEAERNLKVGSGKKQDTETFTRAMTVGMCFSIIKSVSKLDKSLFIDVSEMLINLLSSMDGHVLMGKVGIYLEDPSIKTLKTFTQSIAADFSSSDLQRGSAIALELALTINSGSCVELLSLLNFLLNLNQKLTMPDSVDSQIALIKDAKIHALLDFELINDNIKSSTVLYSDKYSRVSPLTSGIASDGSYLFVIDDAALSKIGTGFNMTTSGKVYASNIASKAIPVTSNTKASESGALWLPWPNCKFHPTFNKNVTVNATTGMTVSTSSSGKSHALVEGIEIGGQEKVAWEFKIVKDNVNNEMTCFGFSNKFAADVDSNYEGSKDLSMYRGYNGQCYKWGVSFNTYEKFHPNDIVRFEADMKAETVNVFINGKKQGKDGKPTYEGIKGPIYPCISFYGTDRTCELVKVEKSFSRTGEFTGHLAFASNKLYGYNLKNFTDHYTDYPKEILTSVVEIDTNTMEIVKKVDIPVLHEYFKATAEEKEEATVMKEFKEVDSEDAFCIMTSAESNLMMVVATKESLTIHVLDATSLGSKNKVILPPIWKVSPFVMTSPIEFVKASIIITNGHQICFSTFKGSATFDINSLDSNGFAILLKSSPSGVLIPGCFYYDVANNVIWQYHAAKSQFGFLPNKGGACPMPALIAQTEAEYFLQSIDASVYKTNAKQLARFILFHLDRVTRPYAKPKVKVSKVNSTTAKTSAEEAINLPFSLNHDVNIAKKLINLLMVKSVQEDSEMCVSILRILQAYTYFVKNTWEAEGIPNAIPDEKETFLKTYLMDMMATYVENASPALRAVSVEARQLFVLCLEEFYPTPEQCGELILQYCSRLANDEGKLDLSLGEIQILASSLVKIDSFDQLSILLVNVKDLVPKFIHTICRLTKKTISKALEGQENIVAIVKHLLSVLFKSSEIILSQYANDLVSGNENVDKYGDMLFIPFLESLNNVLVLANEKIAEDAASATFIRDVLQSQSILSNLAPTMIHVLTVLSDLHGGKTAATLKQTTVYVRMLLKELAMIIKSIPEDEKKIVEKVVSEEVEENDLISSHPVSRDLDCFEKVFIDGASEYTIKFDPLCKLNVNDKLIFYKNKDKRDILLEIRGTDPDFNWGQDLVISNPHYFYHFITASRTDDTDSEDLWGYSMKVIAKKIITKEKISRHWMVTFQNNLASLITKAVFVLNRGSSVNVKESKYNRWLNSELIRYGIDSTPEESETTFFQDFMDRKEGTIGKQLSDVMRDVVKEDQGQDPILNRAVYSVIACVIKHKRWTKTALNIGKLEEHADNQFVAMWRGAQALRNWIGRASSEASDVEKNAISLTSRSLFLLSLFPATPETYEEKKGSHWNHMLKNMKSTKLMRSTSASKWAELLDDAKTKAIDDLTSLLEFQKLKAQQAAKAESKDTSLPGMILEFVKSEVDVSEIKDVMLMRDARANQRVEGLVLFNSILASDINEDAIPMLYKTWNSAYIPAAVEKPTESPESEFKTQLPEDHPAVHYLTNLEGCSSGVRSSVINSFNDILENSVRLLVDRSSNDDSEVVNSIVESLTLDYNIDDDALLFASGLVPIVSRFLTRKDKLGDATWQFFRIIGARLVGLEGQQISNEPESPTPLQISILETLMLALNTITEETPMAGFTIASNTISFNADCNTLVEQPVNLGDYEGGLVSPHVDLSSSHSISMWIWRPKADTSATDSDEIKKKNKSLKNFKFDIEKGRNIKQDMTDPTFRTVMSESSTKGHCVVPLCVEKGKAAWELSITKDSHDNEMTCLGASTSLTPESSNYDDGKELYMYRAYNGATYAKGVSGKTLAKYHQGDIVRVEVDLDKGTIDYKINGVLQDSPAFSGVTGPLYPAVCFYGADRGAKIVSVEMKANSNSTAGSGGCLFTKGFPLLTTADENVKTFPYSFTSAELNDDGHLIYDISMSSVVTYQISTINEIPSEKWTHVAITQNVDEMKIFIDGVEDVKEELPEELVTYIGCDYTLVKKDFESKHNYDDNLDSFEVVSFPGAEKIVITFDEASTTEENNDYIKFYKNDSHTDFWGLEKYSGKKFPGTEAGGEVLVIPAETFVFHFHSNNTTNFWGYKFTAAAHMPKPIDAKVAKRETMNTGPFFIGQMPYWVDCAPVAPIWLANLNIFSHSNLTSEYIINNLLPTGLELKSPSFKSGDRTLRGLSIIKRSIVSTSGLKSAMKPRKITHMLMQSLFSQPKLSLKLATLRVLERLIGVLKPEPVDTAVGEKFVPKLIREIGKGLCVYTFPQSPEAATCRSSADDNDALMSAFISLARTMFESDIWFPLISNETSDILNDIPRFVNELENSSSAFKTSEASITRVWKVLASLAILGGDYVSTSIGSRVLVTGEGAAEVGTVVAASNENNAMSVVMDSEPSVLVSVDCSKIAPFPISLSPKFLDIVQEVVGFSSESPLSVALSSLINANLWTGEGAIERDVEKEVEVSMESDHAYLDGVDEYHTLEIPGATSMEISFSDLCQTVEDIDYLRFYKDDSHTTYWGNYKYSGLDVLNWPGLVGIPPLEIKSGKCVVHFHSSSGTPTWGWRFTARAKVITKEPLHENPPPIAAALLLDLHARGLKIIETFLHSSKLMSSLSNMLRQLIVLSIRTPLQSGKPGRKRDIIKKIETDHPYKDSQDKFELVTMPGVSYIEVSFDERSKTEKDADYVSFFKDASKSSQWGETRYHGGKDGSTRNFPGTDGRPVLKIPSDKFYYKWYSDSSSNDWGFIITCTGVFADGITAVIPISTLDQRLHIINRLLYSSPAMPKIIEKGSTAKKNIEIYGDEIVGQSVDISTDFSLDGSSKLWVTATVLEKKNFDSPINRALFKVLLADGSEKWSLLTKDNSRRRIKGVIDALPYVLEKKVEAVGEGEDAIEEEIPIKKALNKDFKLSFNNVHGGMLSEENTVVTPTAAVCNAIMNGGFEIDKDSEEAFVTWTINILKEEAGNVMTCIGFSLDPVPNSIKYETNAKLYMLRGYNGKLYAAGKDINKVLKVFKQGNDVTVKVNLKSGEVNYFLGLDDLGLSFTLPPATIFYPAVSFYGVGARSSKLTAFTGVERVKEIAKVVVAAPTPVFGGGFGFGSTPTPVAVVTSDNPFYFIEDDDKNKDLVTGSESYDYVQDIKDHIARVWNFAAETLLLLASHRAQVCVFQLIEKLPENELSVDNFGGNVSLFAFLKANFSSSDSIQNILKNRMNNLLIESDESSSSDLYGATLRYVNESLRRIVVLKEGEEEVTKCVERLSEFEAASNQSVDYFVSIPNATEITVSFSDLSLSSSSNSFVTLYKDVSYVDYFGDKKYFGSSWCGTHGKEPLNVNSSSFFVHYELPKGEKLNFKLLATSKLSADQLDSESKPSLDFACWLLSVLMDLKALPKGQTVASPKLDTRNAFQLANKTLFDNLHLCLAKLSRSDEQKLLNVITCILQHVYIDVSNDTVGLKKIIKYVHNKLESQYSSETSDKAKSSYLQALVQCALSLYTNSKSKSNVDKGAIKFDANESLNEFITLRYHNTSALVNKTSSDYKYVTCSNSAAVGNGSATEWYFQLSESVPPSAMIGVQFMTESSRLGFDIEKAKLFVNDKEVADYSFLPKITMGDMFSLCLDLSKNSLIIKRNSVIYIDVDTKVIASTAALKGMCFPFVGLKTQGDSIEISTAKRTVVNVLPPFPWFNNIIRALDFMGDVGKGRAPFAMFRSTFAETVKTEGDSFQSIHPWDFKKYVSATLRASIPGSKALKIIFDERSRMPLKDQVVVYGKNNVKIEIQKLAGDVVGAGDLQRLALGSTVVRGPTWDDGEEDMGAGNIGIVSKITSWKGVENKGVYVVWNGRNDARLYRWGYKDMYDLIPFGLTADESGNTGVLIVGDSVSLEIKRREDLPDEAPKAYFPEPKFTHAGLCEVDGLIAKSTSSSNSCAVVGNHKFEEGKAAWEYEILEDEANNEMSCIGASLSATPANNSYESSPDLYMYRFYNGQLYNKGSTTSINTKVHKGDKIRIELDMATKILAYVINGVRQPGTFTVDGPVYPAVCFYGNNRSLKISKIETPDSAPWGFKAKVIPVFPADVETNHSWEAQMVEFNSKYGNWTKAQDEALVFYVNSMCAKKNMKIDALLKSEWKDFLSKDDDDVTKFKVLADIEAPVGEKTNTDKLKNRFNLVRDFNMEVKTLIPLIDLKLIEKPWSMASLVSSSRHLIFYELKAPLFEDGLEVTKSTSGDQFKLQLSRSRALKFAKNGKCDVEGRFSLFSQAMRQIMKQPNAVLRRHSQLWQTAFAGERSHDAGGPYNEAWSALAQDVQTTLLPLFIRSQNNVNNTGTGRDLWIPNPSATYPNAILMYVTLGKLMGMGIRNKMYLDLSFPSILWKELVNDKITEEDLYLIDHVLLKTVSRLRNIEKDGVTKEMFSDMFEMTFSTTGSDGNQVFLRAFGDKIDVTWDNRQEYCDLILKYRLNEFKTHCQAIRKGLSQIIPQKVLSLFTWKEIEKFVCGEPEINIDLLKSVTDYSGFSESDTVIKNFWKILKALPNIEKTMFLRFTWGRSRLPLNKEAFKQRFSIQRHSGSPADNYMPVSHTCFFQFDLPAYSSETIMKKKIIYAIYNSTAIDADDTGEALNNAAMGFEDF